MKITIAESSPYMGLLTQQTFYFTLDVLARGNKMSVMAMSVAFDQSWL